jgi:hypothetical protein
MLDALLFLLAFINPNANITPNNEIKNNLNFLVLDFKIYINCITYSVSCVKKRLNNSCSRLIILFYSLKQINSRKYVPSKIGVISNTCYYDEVMKECLKKAKIYDLIDNFTFSYSLRIGKPDKQIFETAIERMNINPSQAVMVGNNLKSDINPALDLGMSTIWLNRKNNTAKSNIISDVIPDTEIAHLSELLQYI